MIRLRRKKAAKEPACPHCGLPATRSEEHDAYYCPACNQWLENKCDDPACEFCAGRPERPLGR